MNCRLVLMSALVSLQRGFCESTVFESLGIHTQQDLRPGKDVAAGRRLGKLVVVLSETLCN